MSALLWKADPTHSSVELRVLARADGRLGILIGYKCPSDLVRNPELFQRLENGGPR